MKLNYSRLSRLLCLAFLFCAITSHAAGPPRPNIILILADDLGWGDLGSYGNKTFKTPNLDRLAQDGARLTDFYSPCPYCAPTRAALMTGRYQFRSGMTRNPAPDEGIDDIGLPASELTLAELLKSGGYRTAMIGKWHLGHKPEFNPIRHGFDEYFGILYSHDMRPVQVMEGERKAEYPVVLATLTQRYTDRALAFITQNRRRPFFLYLAHAMPHKPLAASEAFYKKSNAGLYADAMAELDSSVGQILAKLEELYLDEKTLVIFASDNGPWYGGSTGGLRGMKGLNFEGGIRVPCIARWKGKISPGHVSHEPAIMMDLFATCLTTANVPLPADRVLDGRDIFPVFTSDAKSPHEALFSMAGETLRTVRSGNWKLHGAPPGRPRVLEPNEKWVDKRAPDGVTILAPYEQAHPSQFPGLLTGDETKPMSLFDLATDPGEQHDVAAAHPDVVARLKQLYENMNREIREKFPAANLPRARKRPGKTGASN
jgi:N-acetylgalactosamine-6-sulfatase